MNSFASSFETGFEGIYGSWSFGFCLQNNHNFPVAHVTETSLSNLGYSASLKTIYPDFYPCKILSLRFPHPHQLPMAKASNVAWICGTVARVCGMVFDTTVQNLTCSSGCLWPWTTYGMGIHCVEWVDVYCIWKTLLVGSCQVESANAKSSDSDRTLWTPLRLLVAASHCDVFIPGNTNSK